jgi:alpha-1,3-glucosyltransferase
MLPKRVVFLHNQLFMRLSVLACDCLALMPAVLVLCGTARRVGLLSSLREHVTTAAVLLLCPVVILVDHGHFQYNCVALGLTLWAASFALQRTLLAC